MFSTYEDLIKFSTNNPTRLIVLDFKASWCGPCKTLKPFIEYLQTEYPTVVFEEIDIEDEDLTSITENFSIAKVPTLIYIKNGAVCHSLIGTNKENIENAINEYL
jgi:thioredoxin 1